MFELVTDEAIADHALAILQHAGLLPPFQPDWTGFEGVHTAIADGFDVPSTTCTDLMNRFLFGLARASGCRRLVGAGTFVGYAFAYLVEGAHSHEEHVDAVGIDVDVPATYRARQNFARLPHLGVSLVCDDARNHIAKSEAVIDLLFIDIDEPGTRKRGYVDVLQVARPRLRTGSLIVAHDPCVELFADDFARYDAMIRQDVAMRGPFVLPLDECGVSVAMCT